MNANGILEIIGYRMDRINLFPNSIVEEITQNIRMILTTAVGTVPLNRAFGTSIEYIDDPEPRAMMKLSIYVSESIQQFEPRVEVKEIEFVPSLEQALDGKLFPKVKVKIKDEYLVG